MSEKPSEPRPPELSVEAFRQLCTAAAEFRELGPWTYLSDCNMLALQDSNTGQVRLASVLGNAGQVFGLLVHRGDQGHCWALTIASEGDHSDSDPNFAHSQDCLFAEFVARRELETHDRAMLSAIGFKPLPHDKHGWVKFRSLRPGTAPWNVDQAEAELLASDLQKTTHFARLISERKDLFDDRAPNELPFYPQNVELTRPLRPQDLDWQKLVLAPEPPPEPFSLSDSEGDKLDALPRNVDLCIELDCLYSPGFVSEGLRPYFPWLSLAVEATSGHILGSELANSQTRRLEEVAGECLVHALTRMKCRPRKILVRRKRLAGIATLHGLPVGPISLSTTPVPLHKPHARHELHPLD